MTDELAISLFVKAGNPRGDWPALDDRDRWPWRKLATQENLRVVMEMANTPGFEPGTYEVETRGIR